MAGKGLRALAVPWVLTAGSAMLLGLAFPPYALRPLAWVALAPFLVALRRVGPLGALLLTWLWAHLLCYVVWDWGPAGVTTYFEQPFHVAVALFFGLTSTMMAPYFLGFALAYRALARRYALSLPLLAAAAWAAFELARSRLLTGTGFFSGNPWALIGYSQVDFEPLVQIASVTGVYGVSFAVVAVNAGLAELWMGVPRGRDTLRAALPGAALSLLPALVATAFGVAALRTPIAEDPASPETEVAIVQGNVSIGARWRSDLYGENLDLYLELTEKALASGSPRIIFWPEAAMTFFVEKEPAYQRAIGRALAIADAELVGGAPHHDGTRHFNSVFLISPRGKILSRYDKQYLVPFAEFFPFGKIDLLRRSFGRIREFAFGADAPPLPTRAGPAGVLVCNEAWFPEISARRVREGAGYLVNASNESWFEASFTQQTFDMVRLRAIEQRRYVVRAATSGPSAIVDPRGRILTVAPQGARDAILGRIRSIRPRSLYGRLGDLFGLLCGVAVLAAWLLPRLERAGRGGV